MTTMTDEELRQFLKDNMSRIQSMLAEDRECAKDIASDFKNDIGNARDDLREKVSEKKDRVESTAKDVYHAIMDPAAHRHFVRMGLELALGIEAVMEKMPMPDAVKRFRDDVEESRAGVQKEFCRTNDNCTSRDRRDSPQIERIEIN